MNDEPVLEYLQTRGRATPPPTLVDDVLRALDEAPPGRLWFLAFAPVGVAAAIVLLVAGSAFLLSLRPDMTTPPTDAESTTDAASASASATPTPRADAEPITEEGATTTIAAVADGRE